MKGKYLIGIDEAGRGPLAGPVSVGIFAVNDKSVLKRFVGVRDSKKLSEKQREVIFRQIQRESKVSNCLFTVSFSSAKIIDYKGIVFAIKSAINRGLKKLEKMGIDPRCSNVLLDGTLYAPKRYRDQKTIIHGDDIEPIISLASICAKVKRDRKMKVLAKKYPNYGFEIHKGYGTREHCLRIRKLGPSLIHRMSFILKVCTSPISSDTILVS